jgi:CBS domain-containing protein/gamma-glutamylcysteine synthetase
MRIQTIFVHLTIYPTSCVMGESKVKHVKDKKQMQHFVGQLLRDVQALEYMLEHDWFESDIVRIGAEQEMCIIDAHSFKPKPCNVEVLEQMKEYPWVGTELARFNLETNMSPLEFTGDCLRQMEAENHAFLSKIKEKLKPFDADILLTGILPTLRKFDLEEHNLTPNVRYAALMASIKEQRMGSYELRISGIDEMNIQHQTALLEACNTSFQVHLQVSPQNFVQMYNIAQMLAAPVISIAANSPMVFGKRLWHETRIALFQQSLDTRKTYDHMRERSPRVSFGNGWLRQSVVEIHKEDIARFRVLLGDHVTENSLESIAQGIVPKLRALQIHNSTIYRWNRPCYGISPNGKPHLRIENRVLPAGPTILDETANAAFWIGMMEGVSNHYGDITKHISFEDVRDNFDKAAKFGIDTQYTWMKDRKTNVTDLVLKELLPLAQEGLKSRKIPQADIDRYLSPIEERAKRHTNGARWQLRAFTDLKKQVSVDEAVAVMSAAMFKNQQAEIPVHLWEMPKLSDLKNYDPGKLTVEECMETDLFTVQKDDIVDLVAHLMDWRKVRYLPVEDSEGALVGLVTSRLLLRHYANHHDAKKVQTVKEIMIQNPLSITQDMLLLDAMRMLRHENIGCLPVVKGKELVGLITEMTVLRLSVRLLERLETKA